MASGQLQKMKIYSYPDNKFTDGTSLDNYEVLINPESYALTYEVVKNQTTPQGKSAPNITFNYMPSQSLTFKFLFDGTGVVQAPTSGGMPDITPSILGQSKNKRDVTDDLNHFKKIVYGYDGEIHQPRYVQLQWGTLIYNCYLQKMTVTMKLFTPDGKPLRAEAECTFNSAINAEKLTANEGNRSPDLSHVITVKKGDTLPLLCYKEYGDSKYYYQVAQYNGLTDFKILTPGTKLIFPPFAK